MTREYSSHDWRKNTDDAVIVDANTLNKMPVNDSLKIYKPKDLKSRRDRS